jgi:hypothetical protein
VPALSQIGESSAVIAGEQTGSLLLKEGISSRSVDGEAVFVAAAAVSVTTDVCFVSATIIDHALSSRRRSAITSQILGAGIRRPRERRASVIWQCHRRLTAPRCPRW